MRPAAALAMLLIAGQARAALDATLFAVPPSSPSGSPLTVIMQVTNNSGSNAVTDVAPQLQHGGSASAFLAWGPSPATDTVPSLSSRSFTWVYSSSGCGSLVFSGSATGTDGSPVTSDWAESPAVLAQCTPSPTPTITPSPTETPWIVYVTKTIPERGDATILGNVFHPLLSGSLELRYDLPLDGRLTISIYNRLGQLVRRIEKDAASGRGSEFWDGRSDNGSLAGAGIYMAHFRSKGLNKTVKFVIVK